MCVVIASKIKLKNSEKESWFLYKIRDRAYIPEYKIKYNTSKDGVESAFIVDNDSDWSEGVNENGIMIVNAALQNHEDKKDGTSRGKKTSKGKVSRHGVIIREALGQNNIEDAVNVLVDARFDGNTLVSDGKRLFVVEIFLHQNTKDKILADLEIDPIADEEDVKAILAKQIKPEDYDVKVKEITDKDEKLVVRTNHGVFLPKAGYQPKDGEGFDSSHNRRNVTIKTIEELEPEHPFEILTALKNLGSEKIHKKDMMRPIRTMPDSPYSSTTILMLTGTGSMFILPLNCTFEDTQLNRIQKDRDVHVVILPKKLPLFEEFNEEEIIKTLKEENMLDEGIVKKVSRENFENDKFQKWIDSDLGKQEVKGDETFYYNKAGKEVFSYNKKKESMIIFQNGLKFEQLAHYGLKLNEEEENMKCPKCGSTSIEKLDESCKCKDCGYEGDCAEFKAEVNEIKIKDLIKIKADKFDRGNDFIYYDKAEDKYYFEDDSKLVEIKNINYLKDIEKYKKLNARLFEAKFVYSNAEAELKKYGYYDEFLELKKKLKPTHSIVIELDNKDKIVGLTLMPKSEYRKLASDANWEDANVIIYEEKEDTINEETYKEFFTKKLEKFGVKSPDELEGDKKQEFFDEVDAEWKGDNETDEECSKDKKVQENYAVDALKELANGNSAGFISITKDALLKAIGSSERYQGIRKNLA